MAFWPLAFKKPLEEMPPLKRLPHPLQDPEDPEQVPHILQHDSLQPHRDQKYQVLQW